jgi:hypothetical protein
MATSTFSTDIFSADFVLHDDLIDLEVQEIPAKDRDISPMPDIPVASALPATSVVSAVSTISPASLLSEAVTVTSASTILRDSTGSSSVVPQEASSLADSKSVTKRDIRPTFELVSSSRRLMNFVPVKVLCPQADGSYVRHGYTFNAKVLLKPISGPYGNFLGAEKGRK